MIKVEGHSNLYRDEKNGAIVNCDNQGYNQYVRSLEYTERKDKDIENLRKINSKRKIEKILISEDWIKNYSIIQKPFQKKIFIRIQNREPILVLNKEFFYDKSNIEKKSINQIFEYVSLAKKKSIEWVTQ